MKTLRLLFLITFPLVALSCGNQANSERTTSSSNYQDRGAMGTENAVVVDSDSDESFVKEAGSAGLMEVEISQYALQHATNPRVKEFASMMVKDHTQANEELKAIAGNKNLTVTLDEKHSQKMRDLQQKTGNEFDKEYMKEMVDDHQKDVDKFEKMAEDGKDPELKAFAEKTLPKLRMHLEHAKSIRDELK